MQKEKAELRRQATLHEETANLTKAELEQKKRDHEEAERKARELGERAERHRAEAEEEKKRHLEKKMAHEMTLQERNEYHEKHAKLEAEHHEFKTKAEQEIQNLKENAVIRVRETMDAMKREIKTLEELKAKLEGDLKSQEAETQREVEEKTEWIAKHADVTQKGNVAAQLLMEDAFDLHYLVNITKSNKKHEKAMMVSAARLGNLTAKAWCHRGGHGEYEKSRPKAFALFKEAAEAGCPMAQHALGICYYKGLGIRSDEKKAKECWRQCFDGLAESKGAAPLLRMMQTATQLIMAADGFVPLMDKTGGWETLLEAISEKKKRGFDLMVKNRLDLDAVVQGAGGFEKLVLGAGGFASLMRGAGGYVNLSDKAGGLQELLEIGGGIPKRYLAKHGPLGFIALAEGIGELQPLVKVAGGYRNLIEYTRAKPMLEKLDRSYYSDLNGRDSHPPYTSMFSAPPSAGWMPNWGIYGSSDPAYIEIDFHRQFALVGVATEPSRSMPKNLLNQFRIEWSLDKEQGFQDGGTYKCRKKTPGKMKRYLKSAIVARYVRFIPIIEEEDPKECLQVPCMRFELYGWKHLTDEDLARKREEKRKKEEAEREAMYETATDSDEDEDVDGDAKEADQAESKTTKKKKGGTKSKAGSRLPSRKGSRLPSRKGKKKIKKKKKAGKKATAAATAEDTKSEAPGDGDSKETPDLAATVKISDQNAEAADGKDNDAGPDGAVDLDATIVKMPKSGAQESESKEPESKDTEAKDSEGESSKEAKEEAGVGVGEVSSPAEAGQDDSKQGNGEEPTSEIAPSQVEIKENETLIPPAADSEVKTVEAAERVDAGDEAAGQEEAKDESGPANDGQTGGDDAVQGDSIAESAAEQPPAVTEGEGEAKENAGASGGEDAGAEDDEPGFFRAGTLFGGGADNAEPGNDDAEPGNDDAEPGNDDAEPGNDDAEPGNDDEEPPN